MGLRESKLCFLSYEEATKRVTDDEMQRLRLAFKRCCGVSGFMPQTVFAREVVGDGVPSKVAELIYSGFGGTNKGITFRDLLCGLVLLTRGTREEKIKFIFNIYSDGVFVYKDSMESLILACDGGNIPQAVIDCFYECDRLSFEDFSSWLLRNPDVTTVTRWLLIISNGCSIQLTDSSETPTFYQTLASVTHLQEIDVMELEKRYWTLKSGTKTGKFDLETFTPLVSPPIPKCLCPGLFKAFDENCDGHIDFRELACGISKCCRGSNAERQKFCFRVFDTDGDGFLSRSEIEVMCKALIDIRKENNVGEKDSSAIWDKDVPLMANEILNDCNQEENGQISLEEYKEWASTHRFSHIFPKLLVQVCHIVLGLKPATREVELQVVRGWLEREYQHELKAGTIWYLVAISWWRIWKEYVSYQPYIRRSSTGNLRKNGTLPSRLNQVTNLTHGHPGQAWSNDSTGKTRPLIRRESHPSFIHGNTTVSPSGMMNGHCTQGTTCATQVPGPVDNVPLVEPETRKVMILTGEGGKLKRNIPLVRGRDFEIIPEPVWRALQQWYGGGPALPRTVINPTNGDPTPELELYPISLRLFRHSPPPTRGGITTWTGVGFGLSSFGFGTNSLATPHAPPKRYLAYVASFSRMNTIQQVYDYLCARLRIRNEDMRLWSMEDETKLRLLEEDGSSLEKMEIKDNHPVLIEVRNRDMSWPEEMSSLANNRSLREKLNLEPTEKGATGLSNLGNTCFMNSALQCLSNTQPLTLYFTAKCHLYELNRTNPLGMKGHIARRYGDLAQDLWSGSSRSLAPLKLRWTIGRYAPRFNGFQQHDSQEFLSFLLDGLHEDLNRVHLKPYVELKDSDGRPDEEVAHEAWDNHLKRNQSVIVDLFQGQLKSQVRCLECGYVSVRFDPFTFLSLPLPMDNSIYVEVIVVHLEGSTPTKYGLLLNNDDRYKAVKRELSKYCGLVSSQLLLVEIFGASVRSLPTDMQKIRTALAGVLYAYEIPLPAISCEDDCSASTTPGTEEEKGLCTDCSAESNNPCSVNQGTNCQTATPNCNNVLSGEELEGKEGKSSRTNSKNSSEEGENRLKVQEDWFADGKKHKKKASSSPIKRLSPKLRKRLSPKFGGGFNFTLRKSSSSNSSIEMTEGTYNSNSDSGISLSVENSPNRQKLSVAGNTDNASRNSSITSTPSSGPSPYLGYCFSGFVVAMHRKTHRFDAYFLSPQKNRPGLFGVPVIVPCTSQTKQCELYQGVWTQVARLLSPPAPGETNCKDGDAGDFPFELRAVQKDGLTCAWCPWYRFCHGCVIKCSEQEFGSSSSYIAIEWDPTTLHLRYQSSQEKVFTEHESVERSRKMQTEPIDLYECFRAFTKEEELGEDELWYCNRCKKHRLAVKKLDIWSLPPILVIHLKRFQLVNNHWVKSNKIVQFPMEGFDPSAFLAKPSGSGTSSAITSDGGVTTVNVKSSEELVNEEETEERKEATARQGSEESSSQSSAGELSSSQVELNQNSKPPSRHSSCLSLNSAKVHPEVTSENSAPTPVERPSTSDFIVSDSAESQGTQRENVLKVLAASRSEGSQSEIPTYRIYAMSCHTGVLGGGHYISYAHNPNSKWYCYNDSSCKECDNTKLQKDSPYMLFYQQDDLEEGMFLPNFNGQTPDSASDDEEYENEVRRLCVVQ
ncbi:Transcription elongation factorSPT6 [Porites harrisoni]